MRSPQCHENPDHNLCGLQMLAGWKLTLQPLWKEHLPNQKASHFTQCQELHSILLEVENTNYKVMLSAFPFELCAFMF